MPFYLRSGQSAGAESRRMIENKTERKAIMKKIRLGVVGLGHRGRLMFKLAAESFPDWVTPAAACDILPRNWFENRGQFDKSMKELFPGTVFYEDYDSMLKEAGLDAVLIETGADIHAQFCEKALKMNINVLSDIPVVATVEEADRLWKTAQKSKAMFCTGANANFTRYSLIMKHIADLGFLGNPYCMEAEYIHWSLPGSRSSVMLNENGNWRKLLSPIRYCTHSLGPLLALIHEDLIRVSCFGTGPHADSSEYGQYKKDDMQCAQFQTASGIVIRVMRNGRCRAQIGHHSYRIFGTEGYFERIAARGSKNPDVIRYNSFRYYPAFELTEQSGDIAPFEMWEKNKEGHGGCDGLMLEKFFSSLRDGTPPPVSLREGLRMTIPGIYAEMSAKRNGELVPIRYPWD